MIKEPNGGPRLFSSFGFVIPSSLDIRHLKKATFAFVKRRYRFAQVTRKCSLQI